QDGRQLPYGLILAFPGSHLAPGASGRPPSTFASITAGGHAQVRPRTRCLPHASQEWVDIRRLSLSPDPKWAQISACGGRPAPRAGRPSIHASETSLYRPNGRFSGGLLLASVVTDTNQLGGVMGRKKENRARIREHRRRRDQKRAGVPHRRRESFARGSAVHVTIRVRKGVINLRSRKAMRVI